MYTLRKIGHVCRYAAVCALVGCGDPVEPGPTLPAAPSITSINPASATAGEFALILTVTGRHFTAGSVVRWDGHDRNTTFVSATMLTAIILPEDLRAGGQVDVTVSNPPPGGGSSAPMTFLINNPAPSISSVTPAAVAPGLDGVTLFLTGHGFVPSSVVRWDGQDRPTTFVSATELRAAIPAADLTTAGTAQVTVFNPPPAGGTSGAVAFSRVQPLSFTFEGSTHAILKVLAHSGDFFETPGLIVYFLTDPTMTCADLGPWAHGVSVFYPTTGQAAWSAPISVSFRVGSKTVQEWRSQGFPGAITTVNPTAGTVQGWVQALEVGLDGEASFQAEFTASRCGS